MSQPLRILIVEDSENDTMLLVRALQRGGYDPNFVRVDTAAAMQTALGSQAWDIVLADYSLPHFDGSAALQILQASGLDVPFIIVSGIIGEELAVAMLQQGADDYLLKDRLARLGQAVARALEQHHLRKAKQSAEETLRCSEAFNRSILSSLTAHIAVLNRDGYIVAVNEAWEQFAQANGASALNTLGVGANYLEVCKRATGENSYEAAIVLKGLQEILEGSLLHFALEYPCHSPDERRWFLLSATSLPADNGGIVLSHTNITESKLSEFEIIDAYTEAMCARNELEKVNQQLQQAIDQTHHLLESMERESRTKSILLAAIPSILIGIDANDCITQWNAAAEKAFHIPADRVIGKSFRDSGICWEWEPILSRMSECRERILSVRLDDFHFTRGDGAKGILGITITPVVEEEGAVPGLLLLGADITERRLLEGQLAHAQKMESIGQLAAGIAHEINTPIQYVGDNTRFLQEAFQDLLNLLTQYECLMEAARRNEASTALLEAVQAAREQADVDYLQQEVPRAIEQALDGIGRVAKIVQAMKEFSHPGAEAKVAIDLNRAIESTLTISRNEWKYVADLVTELDPTLPPVPCLPDEFNQVILNLLINAAHAISAVFKEENGRRGRITVSTHRYEEWAEIRVSDTGTGIPEAIRSKVFDPFFTTKSVGKGTGQGLAIAHSVVVDKHGGSIHFETEEGVGTTFIIRLPLKPS